MEVYVCDIIRTIRSGVLVCVSLGAPPAGLGLLGMIHVEFVVVVDEDPHVGFGFVNFEELA